MAKKRQCAGCSKTVDTEWCPDCAKSVKPFTVHLNAAQRKRIEALAVVRGVTGEEVLRQALHLLGTRPKITRLSPEDADAGNRIRAGGRLKPKPNWR
jgi:hypothetical protein